MKIIYFQFYCTSLHLNVVTCFEVSAFPSSFILLCACSRWPAVCPPSINLVINFYEGIGGTAICLVSWRKTTWRLVSSSPSSASYPSSSHSFSLYSSPSQKTKTFSSFSAELPTFESNRRAAVIGVVRWCPALGEVRGAL